MFSPCVQLLERNIALFDDAKWAVVNPDDSNVFSLTDNFAVGLHHDFRLYSSCKNINHTRHTFAAHWCNSDIGDVSGVIIFMPKVKSLLPLILANLINAIEKPVTFIVVGENAGGVKSAKTIMEGHLTNVTKLDSARRCSLFVGSHDNTGKVEYASNIKKHAITINDTTLTTCSLDGVFGHKNLDPGTRLLLEHLPTDLNPQSLRFGYDFACGTGIIGAYLSKLYPQISMTYSDVDALAIASTKLTLEENKLEGIIEPCDGFLPTSNKLDIIVTNPPFHNKLKNDYDITRAFIRNAHKQLNRGGVIYLVANKFLPYEESLQETFGKFDVTYADNKYAVYTARKITR